MSTESAMTSQRNERGGPTVADSLREYGRGLAGGLLFSLPLLYTMEVWWAGFLATPGRILVYLAFVLLLLLGYNHYAGIRRDAHRIEVLIDSVEEFGLGVLIAAGALYLIGRIDSQTSFDEALGMILIEAGMVAIGVSVGTAQLGAGDEGESGSTDDSEDGVTLGSQLVIAFCGAVLFGVNVAPTEEIVVIAMESTFGRLIGLSLLSLILGVVILYFAGFARAARFSRAKTGMDMIAGGVATYAVALVASTMILWFFGRFDGAAIDFCVAQTVVLGFPASLGASAGKLLLQGQT